MSDHAGTTGRSSQPGSARGRQSITLRSRLVRYEDRPDRRTMFPPGLATDARMSTWLSADADAFVDLRTSR
jgi:hypothetical protein